MTLRDDITKYINKKYKSRPEHLWAHFPDYVVFRHDDNRKWFAIIMNVQKEKLGLSGSEYVDIINVKLEDQLMVDFMIQQPGYFIGYHFSRGKWISILLDGTVPLEEVQGWIDISYVATAEKKKKAPGKTGTRKTP